ncbi:MAG: FtsX-like permease family protein [Bacilli bacterium]|nr:ABC transporter permease [Acholeplasmataceae bacterium]MDY2902179.1 FtsX-like permease family protein [Bacilli bacterium]
MKKTRFKNIVRSIKGSLNRFLSILFIVAIGSGFMAGLAATSYDMYDTVDKYMEEYKWYDINLQSTIGLTDDDIKAIGARKDVKEVMASKVMDYVLEDKKSKTFTSRVFGFFENQDTPLNKVKLVSGRLPINDDECVIQETSGKYLGSLPKVGETIKISKENINYDELIDNTSYEELKIVGIVESPMCIGIESEPTNVGTGSILLNVYVTKTYFKFDYYTNIYVTFKDKCDSFSDDYECYANSVKDDLASISKVQLNKRVESLITDEIVDQKAYLEMLEKFKNCYNTIISKQDKEKYQDLINNVNNNLKDQNLKALLKGLEYSSNNTMDEERIKGIFYSIILSQVGIDNPSWIIRTRNDATGFNSYKSNVGKVKALSKIFPVFFFLVALLVALTTMTRLVEENRTQIGTLKAIGFSNGQILSQYMIYSLLACFLGSVLGLVVGFKLFPKAISSAYSMMYTIPKTLTPFRFNIAFIVAPVTIGSILIATFFACYQSFKAMPAVLMVPSAPKPGKRILIERISFIWNKLSFSHKVMWRNLFRYKKRLFMTIIGVAGCSALLLTGFGLKDSISDIVSIQFNELYKYDLTILTTENFAASKDEVLNDYLQNKVNNWMYFSSETGKISNDNKNYSVSILVPDNEKELTKYITFRNRKTKKEFTISNGVVLSEKLAEELGVKVGDTVVVENEKGIKGKIVVEGITENYIQSFVYITKDMYKTIFNDEPLFKLIYCNTSDSSDNAISDVMKSESVMYARSSLNIENTFSETIKSIDGVILVLILAAGLLCIVVEYNLTNVNICERKKELSTMRVLGFYNHEVDSYIFRETNLLSIIGGLVGLLIGIWLHSFVVKTVEVNQVMFGRTIYFHSYVYAMIITIVFTILVDQVMRKSIRNIDMVEAMKAND